MIEAKIIVETRRESSQGYAVKIEVYANRTYKYISLKKYQKSKTLKIDSEIARRIGKLEEEIQYCNNNKLSLEESLKIIKDGIPDDKDMQIFLLKKKLAELQGETGVGLIEFFDIRIKEIEDLNGSSQEYKNARIQVVNFLAGENDILLNNIDYEWLQSFIRYKTKFGKGKGNVTFLLKTIRAVFKEAQRRESLNVKKGNPFLGLIKNNTTKEVCDLTVEEIKKLFNYEPRKSSTKKSLFVSQRHIDIFLFQFAIGGHDYADIANLKWTDVKNGRIKFKRYKNRNKPNGGERIDNMLSKFALSTIEQYGDKNHERIFSHIPSPDSPNYISRRQNAGQSLRRISNTLKLSENLKTKTPRYLFRSFSGDLQINALTIMQIQGHKPEGITYKYQRKLSYEVIDKEHEKVLKLFWE
ncbi:phage integrase SAM-like domain-containing protein [Aquimarina algiphila]|uniref:phage integrase SAM-like domain-containing protein n=1 Tax=Aquimarina algiphila TaxID=2047982 RepID=UPI00232C5047|nr:phage integrase SAM-like domain-containing protein [Aquimarina algiphila]